MTIVQMTGTATMAGVKGAVWIEMSHQVGTFSNFA
jgi:hypothetical protein